MNDTHQQPSSKDRVAFSPEITQVRAVLAKHMNEYSADLLADLAQLLTATSHSNDEMILSKTSEERLSEFEEKHCQNITDVGGFAMAKTIRDDVRTLLTSHSQAIRERVEGMKKPPVPLQEADDDKWMHGIGYNQALDDILALLNDSDV